MSAFSDGEEVQRWLLDTSTPFRLANEAAQRGLSNQQMADLVLAQWDAWQTASDQVEAVYVQNSTAINAATSPAEAGAILAQLQ